MKISIFILLFISIAVNCFSLQVTEEQFKNLHLIHKILKDKYPAFQGFNGNSSNLEVLGISESIAAQELQTINIEELKLQDPKRLERKQIRKKLKTLGLSNEDLVILGLTNDIPDNGAS